ncbi:MAG: aspartate/glutamate racemase family protein, partial [Gracilimonas sp.]|nr:aspartate/glutamate racemase family protein [Gracilimonas sp.]
MQDLKNAPIGIFDSGIGGLTVAKAVIEALPNEDIIYFGDTARVPYGIKSEKTVRAYALQITNFLLKRGVKMILIACNTVSASAKEEIIQAAGNIPVLDVITAGTKTAILHSGHKNIGVIGTLGTVNS